MKFFISKYNVFCLFLFLFGCKEVPKEASKEVNYIQCLTASPVKKMGLDEPEKQELPQVHFLVTADPQYDENLMNPDGTLSTTSDEISRIIKHKLETQDFRGLLIAGDLTHNSKAKEFVRYQKFTEGMSSKVYEGLGNHDFRRFPDDTIDIKANQAFGFQQFMNKEVMGWNEGSLRLFEYIRSHKREANIHSSFPNIHYSWDWEDIHFVQLNLFPGDEPVPRKTIQNPFMAFTFLKKDLAEKVGDSGRPIVLIHHYGFDNFSRGIDENGEINVKGEWWTAKQRRAYWDLLSAYNVLAIFSGHAHNCQGCDNCYLPWDGTSVGRENVQTKSIPTFVSGSAREGCYLECSVYDDRMIVRRFLKEKPILEYQLAIRR